MTFTSFEGQTAVVSGGTRGIGRAVVLDLLEQGARVHATYVADEDAAERLRDEAVRFDGRLALRRFDVGDYAQVERFWNALGESEPDGVQVLVSNAGRRRDKVLAMMPEEDWEAVLRTNLTGSFHMCKFAVLAMVRRRYGRIVLVTSPAGKHGFEGQTNYAASKAGQVGLVRSLCKEVAKRGITVNCVSPGFVDTELLADLPEDVRAAHARSVPVGRFGTPAEIASAVRFLASPEASYVNGSVLEVTGGL